jgi:hypothetical protein
MSQNTRRYFEELGQSLEGRSPDSPEFAALLRSKIGKDYQHLVNPETIGLAALIGDPRTRPSNLYGLNTGSSEYEGTKKSLLRRIKSKIGMDEDFGKYFDEIKADRPPKTWTETITGKDKKRIFALGNQADPETWAHEFRHEEIKNEESNRIYDLLNSTSYPDYKNKINMWYQYGRKLGPKIPFDEKERIVLEQLRINLPLEIYEYMKRELSPEDKNSGKGPIIQDAIDFLNANIDLNRAGAKGPYDPTGKQLDRNLIKARADIPLLNFIGKGILESAPNKKASGGSIENTTHDRKII